MGGNVVLLSNLHGNKQPTRNPQYYYIILYFPNDFALQTF